MPAREVNGGMVGMANRATSERTAFAENAHAPAPAGLATNLRWQGCTLRIGEAVGRVAGVMPYHFARAPDEFIHDVRFAATRTDQWFTPMDAQRIDVDTGRHKKPLTLA